jgi:hypothetical protein
VGLLRIHSPARKISYEHLGLEFGRRGSAASTIPSFVAGGALFGGKKNPPAQRRGSSLSLQPLAVNRQPLPVALPDRSAPALHPAAEQIVQSSWGKPQKINVTITSRGKYEQLVYAGFQYLYLEDGVLASIQTSR